ncbi:NAD(P)/FAD-dependent oxidoreductase [Jeotgalibacillus sp. R-1-5s-1]|uniref:NAD(P)/FAD-dependent oxidoreductase n=1 Tax=Jeotgalibacillus sp. R-1-5s-1 TaxID=2555897 RepID=UPI00106D11B4|nr:NAD(P)/FAD-dependent oxidoreductase [Jeotgalibacillus sp. R-1-5s-1]TFD99688.1 NAD(P)/FAD-dependent oxidoreductase [Jeotgalibacillus sp. R-1-5s-1]
MMRNELYDVTIIGGGPAGLYSAFYSGLRGMKTKILEYQPHLGGKVNVYPEKMIWDAGGMPPVTGAKMVEQMIEQGLTFDPSVYLNEKVDAIRKNEDGHFEVTAASGNVHLSKTVIVAVGSGILNPQKLQIEGAERFEVTNLHYTVQSLKKFKDKTVLISGGGNTAIDWANELEPIAKKVYITHRSCNFKGHEAQIGQLMKSSAVCLLNTQITKLQASAAHDAIERVELTHSITNEVSYLDVDDVIINHGYEIDASLIKNSELPIDMADDYFIKACAAGGSTVPGLYAAGDIVKHEGKLNLLMGAFHDAANAVNQAKRYITPDAGAAAMVSSHNDVFKDRNRELVKKL